MGLTFEKLFSIFDGSSGPRDQQGLLTKEKFLTCVQGLGLDMALEDLMELFNYMDDKSTNTLGKVQFVDALTFVTNKLGGSSFLESGSGKQKDKRGASSRQAVLNILNSVAEAVHKKQLQMRQVFAILDVNGTGYISRTEFSQVIRALSESITHAEAAQLHTFFDERGTGRLAVQEVAGLL